MQCQSACTDGGGEVQSEEGLAELRACRVASTTFVQITMTPTLDTKLVNMPPHNFDPAEVPDADMCEFLGGSMGTPGTRRGSPGETVAAWPFCMARHLVRTGSAWLAGTAVIGRSVWPAIMQQAAQRRHASAGLCVHDPCNTCKFGGPSHIIVLCL